MADFEKVAEFNKRLAEFTRLLGLHIEVKEYADLKKDPEAYSLLEEKNYLKFIAKDCEQGHTGVFTIFIVLDMDGVLKIDLVSVYGRDLKLMNKLAQDGNWLI